MGKKECGLWLAGWAEFIDNPPKIRADCQDLPRPCPWDTCPHHLRSLIIGDKQWVKKSDEEKLEFLFLHHFYYGGETCALDVAKLRGLRAEDIAIVLHHKCSNTINNILSIVRRKLRLNKELMEVYKLILEERT